jgi:hypothetical protein
VASEDAFWEALKSGSLWWFQNSTFLSGKWSTNNIPIPEPIPEFLYIPEENYVKAAKSGKKGRELSWVPVRNGDIYCSPACGAKCLIDEFLQAQKEAEWLVAELGNSWTPRVWENMGWFYSAKYSQNSLEMEMHPNGEKYWCDLRFPGIYQIIADNGSDPQKLVAELIKKATKLRDSFSQAIYGMPLLQNEKRMSPYEPKKATK